MLWGSIININSRNSRQLGLNRVSTADQLAAMYNGVITLPQLCCLMGLELQLRTLIHVSFCDVQVNILTA